MISVDLTNTVGSTSLGGQGPAQEDLDQAWEEGILSDLSYNRLLISALTRAVNHHSSRNFHNTIHPINILTTLSTHTISNLMMNDLECFAEMIEDTRERMVIITSEWTQKEGEILIVALGK